MKYKLVPNGLETRIEMQAETEGDSYLMGRLAARLRDKAYSMNGIRTLTVSPDELVKLAAEG